jgi:hypothetical protein
MTTLLQELVQQDALFCKELHKPGRLWFTKRVLDYQPIAVSADKKAAATAVLNKAKKMTQTRLDVKRGSLVDDLKRTEQNEIRARIVYGLLGTDLSTFVDFSNDQLLDFIVERRYRSIQRMVSFINPSRDRKILAYPSAGPITAQVSKQAGPFWEGVTSFSSGPKVYPFVLTDKGKQSPENAIEQLFAKNETLEDRTRIDCPAAAMVTHLDALLVAKNSDLLAKMVEAGGQEYLAIDHPFGSIRFLGGSFQGGFTGWVNKASATGTDIDIEVLSAPRMVPPFDISLIDADTRTEVQVTQVTRNTSLKEEAISIPSSPLVKSTLHVTQPDHHSFSVLTGNRVIPKGAPPYHVITDRRLNIALFDQSFVVENDLLVGDHIYVANHPLHRSRLGSTIWNGEHSFILDPWQGSRAKIIVTGHGVAKLTIAQVVWVMLEEINAFLEVTRQVIDRWLALPASKPPDAQQAADAKLREVLGRVLLQNAPSGLNGTFRIFNFPKIAYRKNSADRNFPPYWAMDVEGDDGGQHIDRKQVLIFDYDPVRTVAKQWPTTKFTNLIAVLRHVDLVNAGGPEKTHYAVSYIDDNAGVLVFMPLYYPDGPRQGKPVQLGYSDIQDSVIMSDPDEWIFVTRPRVLATPAYLTYLKQIGALSAD